MYCLKFTQDWAINLFLFMKGSLILLGFVLDVSYIVFMISLCIEFQISPCRACICKCLGVRMNVSPILSTCFCMSLIWLIWLMHHLFGQVVDRLNK